ncbi:MAG: protein-glutamate O-methyltransferase CheR [Synergistaceae bacterium]|jgi:chemotaxis protein methyltransferase CheR|nr:protein-glutamate O-methyltransferase CheR [Synergistaceae bacterium]
MVGLEEANIYNSPEYEAFKQKLRKIIGLDLNSYKNQIHRRVHMLMERWNVKTYDEYFNMIRDDDKKLREFLDHLTINVSEFFRNDKQWWKLRDQLIPDLIKKHGHKRLKLWSAGCATGEEPYSLAILSTVCGLDQGTPVLACDIDQGALAIAQKGVYLKRQLLSVPPEYLSKYFTTTDRGETYQVTPEIKRRVTFRRFNMIDDTFGSGFDIILCRNVVIYFTAETKAGLYKKFYNALAPGGYFLVGSTEQIFEYKKMGFDTVGPFLYTRS